MGNLSKREKILIIIAAVLMVLGGYFYLLYQPLAEDIEHLQNEVNVLEDEYSAMLEKINQIPELEEELAELKEERETILEMGYRDPEEIVAVLTAFSRESNISLNGYSRGEADGGFPFELQAEGRYGPLLQFIWLIDSWDYRLEVTDFEFSGDDEEEVVRASFGFFFHQWDDMEEFVD